MNIDPWQVTCFYTYSAHVSGCTYLMQRHVRNIAGHSLQWGFSPGMRYAGPFTKTLWSWDIESNVGVRMDAVSLFGHGVSCMWD